MFVRWVIATTFLLSVGAGGAQVTSDGRHPWQWTAKERIRVRFDPESNRKRGQAGSARTMMKDAIVIEGARNPELFFPWELMDRLLDVLATPPSHAQSRRELYRQAIAREGWNYDFFWQTVEDNGSQFVAAKLALTDVLLSKYPRSGRRGKPVPTSEYEVQLRLQMCRSRAEALANSRAILGAERFDEFLYLGVAPSLRLWTTKERDGNTLMRVERGFQ